MASPLLLSGPFLRSGAWSGRCDVRSLRRGSERWGNNRWLIRTESAFAWNKCGHVSRRLHPAGHVHRRTAGKVCRRQMHLAIEVPGHRDGSLEHGELKARVDVRVRGRLVLITAVLRLSRE